MRRKRQTTSPEVVLVSMIQLCFRIHSHSGCGLLTDSAELGQMLMEKNEELANRVRPARVASLGQFTSICMS